MPIAKIHAGQHTACRILKVIRRSCLVFNNFVMTPNEEVIPADQSRLHVLLSHELTIGTLPYFVSEANLKPYFLYIAHMLGVELCWPFRLYQSTTQNR